MPLPARRISLECPVARSNILERWLGEIDASSFDQLAPADLHFTMLYLGRPSEIYEVVNRARADFAHRPLDINWFLGSLRAWLQVHALVARHESSVSVQTLGTLGEGANLALVGYVQELPLALRDLHEVLLRSFEAFLERDLNVPDGAALVNNSPAFGFSGKSWVPHISLGRTSKPLPMKKVEPIRIDLQPMRVRNVSSLQVVV